MCNSSVPLVVSATVIKDYMKSNTALFCFMVGFYAYQCNLKVYFHPDHQSSVRVFFVIVFSTDEHEGNTKQQEHKTACHLTACNIILA